jgi:hypothetical protein
MTEAERALGGIAFPADAQCSYDAFRREMYLDCVPRMVDESKRQSYC